MGDENVWRPEPCASTGTVNIPVLSQLRLQYLAVILHALRVLAVVHRGFGVGFGAVWGGGVDVTGGEHVGVHCEVVGVLRGSPSTVVELVGEM